jgi:hypothetical protein
MYGVTNGIKIMALEKDEVRKNCAELDRYYSRVQREKNERDLSQGGSDET